MTYSQRCRDVAVLIFATSIGCAAPPHENDAAASVTQATDPRVGTRVHVTGCEHGELVVPLVNLWDSPARRKVVGQVSGAGSPCEGAVVIIRNVSGDSLEVETTEGDPQRGWITSGFIGSAAP